MDSTKVMLALKQCLYFLIISGILFGLHWLFSGKAWFPSDFNIHILLFALTFIVVVSIAIFYIFSSSDKIGFVYLGFVIFKMFGIGYLAVFQNGFREYLLVYFVIFWIYLAVEATLVVNFLKKK